jgi:predicted RNA methylase
VFRPRHGQAHQQYFTPRWLCQACANITEKLFNVPTIQGQRGGYPPPIIDPTCGSGRLLAPFSERCHKILGVELDDRLVPVARRAVDKGNVRKGDIGTYASVLPSESWHVAVINPPHGLWWPVTDTPLAEYELASAENIESQHMVLELAMKLIRDIRNAGEKVLTFTSLRGLYSVMEKAPKTEGIGYTRMDGLDPKAQQLSA